MFDLLGYPGPLAVQINDYEIAGAGRKDDLPRPRSGLLRLVSLIWRHHQERLAVGRADRVVCNSHFTRREVIAAYHPKREQRVITIRKAVDLSQFARPFTLGADPLPDRPKGGRLVFVGTNWRIKGLSELVTALPIVAKICSSGYLGGRWTLRP